MRRSLQSFSQVSVRDTRTEVFIDKILKSNKAPISKVPDPTFFLPTPTSDQGETFAKLVREANKEARKVVLVVAHAWKEGVHRVVDLCRKKGYFSVSLSVKSKGVDLDLSSAEIDPLEWAASYQHCDLVITDRFHTSVFSLKSSKKVIAMDYRSQDSGQPSKINELLASFGLSKWRFPKEQNIDLILSGIEKVMDDDHLPASDNRKFCRENHKRLTAFASSLHSTI